MVLGSLKVIGIYTFKGHTVEGTIPAFELLGRELMIALLANSSTKILLLGVNIGSIVSNVFEVLS